MPFRLRFVTLDLFLVTKESGICSFITPYAGTTFPCKMKCKPKIQKSMVCNSKGNGGEKESRENVYQFFILEISMKCHKYEIINEILIRISILMNVFFNNWIYSLL